MAPTRPAVLCIAALLFIGGAFGASSPTDTLQTIAQDIQTIIGNIETEIPEVAQSITNALDQALEVVLFKQVTGSLLTEVDHLVDDVLRAVEGTLLGNGTANGIVPEVEQA